MKSIVIILFFLMFANLTAFSQNEGKSEYYKIISKLSNNKASFGITGPVRIKDSLGKVVSIKTLVELENSYMKKISAKYGKKLIPDLLLLLKDTTRDWAANILLYALTESSAVTIKYYSFAKIDEWRSIKKEDDIAKWQNYIKEQKNKNKVLFQSF